MLSLGMSLRLEPELRTEQRLEHKLRLEQKLEQMLQHQLNPKVILAQYLEQEDFIKGLIRWADDNNSWVNFDKDGFDFRYAVLPYEIAKPIADQYGPGFAHCLYNPFEGRVRGQWNLFVVRDMIDPNFEDFVALHERGEELSLGNHYFSS